jgi:hypothetical protein
VTAVRYLRVTTEIDLTGRTIRKAWKALFIAWKKVYGLDDYATVEIQDKSRLMEGYPLPLFAVLLSAKGHRLKIYSTDDFEDAKAVQKEIGGFLSKAGVSTLNSNK